eukprot:403368954
MNIRTICKILLTFKSYPEIQKTRLQQTSRQSIYQGINNPRINISKIKDSETQANSNLQGTERLSSQRNLTSSFWNKKQQSISQNTVQYLNPTEIIIPLKQQITIENIRMPSQDFTQTFLNESGASISASRSELDQTKAITDIKIETKKNGIENKDTKLLNIIDNTFTSYLDNM